MLIYIREQSSLFKVPEIFGFLIKATSLKFPLLLLTILHK